MSRRMDADIAVVGAGLVGATAALALACAGFEVCLLDAGPAPMAPSTEMDLRVLALAPSSARLLADVGAWARMDHARICAYEAMHVWDAETGVDLDFDARLIDAQCLGWIAENRHASWTLWQALAESGMRTFMDVAVRGYAAQDTHAALELDNGEYLRVRLVVAADGRASSLRQHAGIPVAGRDYGQRAIVAHLAPERAHEHAAWQRFLLGGPLALLPLADGRVSLVWSLPDAEASRVLALSDAEFAAAVAVASDYRLGALSVTSGRAAFPLRLQVAQQFAMPRLVLIGDAAHTVHPLAGQGVNLGLRDVRELVEVLSGAGASGADFAAPAALARYARRRRSADALDAWSFDAIERCFGARARPLVLARAFGMGLVQHAPSLKRMLARHAAGRPA